MKMQPRKFLIQRNNDLKNSKYVILDCNELRELKDAIMSGNPVTIVKEG